MEKILGSERALDGKMKAVMNEFGYTGGKAKIICKCESAGEANEKAKNAGLGSRWFLPDCCAEIRESQAINLLAGNGVEMAVCVDGKNYLAIDSDIRERLLR